MSGPYARANWSIELDAFTFAMSEKQIRGSLFGACKPRNDIPMLLDLYLRGDLMLVGAGPKGNQPLVLTRGGQQYRGFLEGRTQGDKYCLILHLSNMELKAAPQAPATEEAGK